MLKVTNACDIAVIISKNVIFLWYLRTSFRYKGTLRSQTPAAKRHSENIGNQPPPHARLCMTAVCRDHIQLISWPSSCWTPDKMGNQLLVSKKGKFFNSSASVLGKHASSWIRNCMLTVLEGILEISKIPRAEGQTQGEK